MKRDAWNQRYSGTELIWTAQPNRFLVAEAEDLPPGRALDLACGEGRNAVWLARRGWSVTGVDFAGVGLAKAARLAEEAGVEAEWDESDDGREPLPLAGRVYQEALRLYPASWFVARTALADETLAGATVEIGRAHV